MALPPSKYRDEQWARAQADPTNYRERRPDEGVGPRYVYDPRHAEKPPGATWENSSNKIDTSND